MMDKGAWTLSQLKSRENSTSVLSYTLIAAMGVYFGNMTLAAAAFAVFFLITAWEMLSMMLFFTIIIGVLTAIFPFLAPIAVVLMIFFFLARIQFIFSNWRAVLAGFVLYGMTFGLVMVADDLDNFFVPYIYVMEECYDLFEWYPEAVEPAVNTLYYYMTSYEYAGAVIVAFLSASVLQLLLIWLYRNGYTTHKAMGIMGSVPLLIIALILPFLKVASGDFFGGDAFDGGTTGDVHTGDAYAGDVHTGDAYAGDTAVLQPAGGHDAVTVDGYGHDGYVGDGVHGDAVQGEYHHVNGYLRHTAHGTEYVRPHLQGNPDGIVENNLSYHGQSVIMPEAKDGGVIDVQAADVHTDPVADAYVEDADAWRQRKKKADEE